MILQAESYKKDVERVLKREQSLVDSYTQLIEIHKKLGGEIEVNGDSKRTESPEESI